MQQWSGGVTSYPHSHIGFEITDNLVCLTDTFIQFEGQGKVLPERRPLYALDVEADNLISRIRYLSHFHFPIASHEQQYGIWCQALQRIGNSDGREDMPSCTASADDNPFTHIAVLALCSLLPHCGDLAHNNFLVLLIWLAYPLHLIDITAYAQNDTEG